MAKAQPIPSPKTVQTALDRIDTLTTRAATTRAAGAELDVQQSLKEVCKVYRQLRPQVDAVLNLIASLGTLFGYDFARIAAALRKVLELIDMVCV